MERFARRTLAMGCAGILLAQLLQSQSLPGQSLADKSLEQLMNIQVTSVGKKTQSLQTAAASVYVISSEDIRRSGMRTLPDLLRMAPGVQVARVASGAWAISIRGFSDQYANKLLVLVNGRSVYNQAFGGVYWDMLDIGVEDIDRIEVIRGPAAAMWGPNAVNGVINILTNLAKATQGGSVTAEAGSESEAGASVRYGGELGTRAQYRVSGGASTFAPLSSTGPTPSSGWTRHSLGFRMDWTPDADDSLTISGQGMESASGYLSAPVTPANPFPTPRDSVGRSYNGNVMSSWRHLFRNGSSLEARGSWESVDRGEPSVSLNYSTSEGELKYHTTLGSRQDLIAGFDFKGADYRIGSGIVHLNPPQSRLWDESVFFQDEIELIPNRLSFIAGAYLGRYSFAGFQIQPTGRLLWTPSHKVSMWAAISRAVRTPALLDLGISATYAAVPAPPLVGIVRLTGNPRYKSEPTLSYETGQRLEVNPRLSLDFSEFFTVYHGLDSQVPLPLAFVYGGAATPPYIDIPYRAENARYGRSYGGEVSASWMVARRWTLTGGYSRLYLATDLYSPASHGLATQGEGGSPQNQWEARSHVELTRRLEWDTALYFTGRIPTVSATNLRGDMRLAWRAGEHLGISAGIQNALRPEQLEALSAFSSRPFGVQRNVFGAFTWSF
jgi:iron complex outermembrane receptor protein